nr:hypothetical protein [Tanacetum cinerariifolium]
MADNRTMDQMLQAPIEGYEDAIVVSQINANNFELKQTLINLVQSNQFTGRQDPHNHLRFFNKVTSTFRHSEVPNTTINKTRLRKTNLGVEQQEPIEETTDTELPSTEDIKPPLVQVEVQVDKPTEEPSVVIPKAKVKDKQEKDKIGSKPNKNGKRGEAGKSQKQLQ